MAQIQERDRNEQWRDWHSEGRVAPHEGQELQLVADGTKPLAVIERAKDIAQYYLALAGYSGLVVQPHIGAEGAEMIVVREGSEELIDHYLHLIEHGVSELGLVQYHREMGRLFGYSEADIQAFIDSEIDCQCSKCKGATA